MRVNKDVDVGEIRVIDDDVGEVDACFIPTVKSVQEGGGVVGCIDIGGPAVGSFMVPTFCVWGGEILLRKLFVDPGCVSCFDTGHY
jgi:hypothetical protein